MNGMAELLHMLNANQELALSTAPWLMSGLPDILLTEIKSLHIAPYYITIILYFREAQTC